MTTKKKAAAAAKPKAKAAAAPTAAASKATASKLKGKPAATDTDKSAATAAPAKPQKGGKRKQMDDDRSDDATQTMTDENSIPDQTSDATGLHTSKKAKKVASPTKVSVAPESAPMDVCDVGELANLAQSLALEAAWPLELTSVVESYCGNGGGDTSASEVFPSLHAHLSALLSRLTPLPALTQSLVLDLVGVTPADYLPLPSGCMHQPVSRVHYLRPPSSSKLFAHPTPVKGHLRAPSPTHPLVIEFCGSSEEKGGQHQQTQQQQNQPTMHLIQNAQVTPSGAWCFLWNELLPDSAFAASAAAAPAAAPRSALHQRTPSSADPDQLLPASSASTYSLHAGPAVGASYTYMQSSPLGLTLIGDRLVTSAVFVEWKPKRDPLRSGDYSERAWQCWKINARADKEVKCNKGPFVPETPEKE